jgi:hypothetical protein
MTTIDTTETVRIGRVAYAVTRTGDENTPYELHGPRGAHYGLMRNVNTPHLLFMFNMRGFTKGTPDVWFTDKTGRLEVLR